MWLMTTRGFYSAVAHRDDPDKVMVRARTEDDLNALIELVPSDPEPIHTPNADYQWRIVVTAAEWAGALTALALDVDYPNFKNAVKSPKHKTAYTRVWGTMYDALDDRARMWAEQDAEEMGDTPFVGYKSVEDWAGANGLTVDEAIEVGVTQDAEGTVWVPREADDLIGHKRDLTPISFVTPIYREEREHEKVVPFFDPPETAA